MPRLIKKVRGENIIEFDRGRFDDWCVYLKRPSQARYAPLDYEYFSKLQALSAQHSSEKIYNDFVTFYNPTGKSVDENLTSLITQLSDTYKDDAEEIDIWFSVIYGGMIAEENKQFAILKKRVKRLGMYQVLIEGSDPHKAANFSKGIKWRELDKIMKERGF